jgi:uncharacterized membrane protein YkvA (DUF1232 family)
MALTITFDLSDKDLDLLSKLIETAKSKAVSLSEGEIIAAARRVLVESGSEVADFIRERLEKLRQLIEMLEDQVWDLTGDDRARVLSALAYFADPDDIIPDDVPGFGLLDDAVVIDLVCQSLQHDIDAYQDFRKFREAEEARRGKSVDPLRPEQWLRTRRVQLHDRMRRRRVARWQSKLGRSTWPY